MNWSRREAFSPSPMGCLQDAYATYIKLAKLWGNYSHTDGQRLTNGQWFKECRRFTQRDIQPYGKCGLSWLCSWAAFSRKWEGVLERNSFRIECGAGCRGTASACPCRPVRPRPCGACLVDLPLPARRGRGTAPRRMVPASIEGLADGHHLSAC